MTPLGLRVRILIIALLVSASLFFHGTALHQMLAPAFILGAEGFDYDPSSGRAVITAVRDKTIDGSPTAAEGSGLAQGDVILAVINAGGTSFPIAGRFDFGNAIRTIGWGEPWALQIERPTADGSKVPLHLNLSPVPRPPLAPSDFALIFGIYCLVPFLSLGAAALIGLARPADNHAFRASLMFICFSSMFYVRLDTLPDIARWIGLFLSRVGPLGSGLLVLHFFLRFPSPPPFDRRFPWVKHAASLVFGALILFRFSSALTAHLSFRLFADFSARVGRLQWVLDKLYFPLLVLAFVLSLFVLVQSTAHSRFAGERRRMVLLLVGMLSSLVPLVALVLWQLWSRSSPLLLLLLLAATAWLFPGAFVYAVIRHQVFGIRLILRRGLQYALLTRSIFIVGLVLFGLLYLLLGEAIARLFPENGQTFASVGTAGLALGLAAGLRELNRRVLPKVDRAFFRDAYDARQILLELADAVYQLAAEPNRLLAHLAEQIQAALHPRGVLIYLRRDEADWLIRAVGPQAETKNGAESESSWWVEETPPKDPFAESFCCTLFLPPAPSRSDHPAPAHFLDRPAIHPSPRLLRLLETAAQTPGEPLDVPSFLEATAPLPFPARPEQLPGQRPGPREPIEPRLIIPLGTRRRLFGFIVLGEKLSEEPFTREDRELLLSVANQTAVALDYSELISELAEKERWRRELEIAQEVQAQLFPQKLPEVTTLAYTGSSQPARTLGGDYFDFIPLGLGRIGIALADLAGKGISAALLMATLQGQLRSHAPQWGDRIDKLVADLNRQLLATIAPNKFATLFYAVYDERQRTLSYVTAGHNPPLLIRGPNSGHPGQIEQLDAGGTVVGLLPDQTWNQAALRLAPGDLLIAFSDGLVDSPNPAGDLFGERRLRALVLDLADRPPEEIRQQILAEIAHFAQGAPQEDDITLIVAKALP